MDETTLAIDPAKVCLWVPPDLKKFKLDLFNRIAATIERKGGRVVRHDERGLLDLPDEIIPIIGCHPPLRGRIAQWKARGRKFIYWDRGYAARWFATCLPQPASMEASFYRWHIDAFQLTRIRDVPDDRWKRLNTEVKPWQKNGRHIVIAAPTVTYSKLHGCENWIAETISALAKVTDRQFVIRDKEQYRRRPIQKDLDGAHALVTHGSNAANEAIILGCPVFCHTSCAAALVGKTDFSQIERPVYPDRQPWLNSLGYSQFTEGEVLDGTMWKLID
jgi:hypothetical protein